MLTRIIVCAVAACAAVGASLFWMADPLYFRVPRDGELIEVFRKHRAAFERLRQMAAQSGRRGIEYPSQRSSGALTLMPTTSLFSGVVRAVTRELKRSGFAAKAGTFSRELENGNTIALAIQRSVKSTPDEVLVTVNYWVFSSRLAGKLGEDRTSARDYSKAHWRKRLAEDGKEQWIAVRSPDAGAALVIDAIGRTLPDLMEHSTDAALRDEWQVGRGPGLGRMQRLLYLAILLNELGPTERIPAVLAELRKAVAGGPHERLVEMRLEQAGVSS